MRAIRLIGAADEFDSASPGLIIKGTPLTDGMMADRDGTLIAHDLLEHQNGVAEIGSVWDELEALGGIWQVRGRHGDLLQRSLNIHSPTVNVASDITRMFCDWEGYHGPGRPTIGTRSSLYDEDFAEIIKIARHGILCEYDGEENSSRATLDEYLALALRRMRIGFRKAERRFGSDYAGYSLFYAIREAVDTAIKRELEYEGQEFVLRYGGGDATCRSVSYNEDYWT